MTELADYIYQFSHLRRANARHGHYSATTRMKAPHKPILLLAVLDLVARGVISSAFVDVTGDMIELNELFNLYWRRVMPLGQNSSIAFPFPRLDGEPFWKLIPQPGRSITQALINDTTSVSFLRKYALGATIDKDLFIIMQSISELSGGMKRRIALARTLILQPKIILYDEPTTGLDPITSKEIILLMMSVQKKYNTSSIIITHDVDCARVISNRMILLIDNINYAEGTFEELSTSEDPKIKAFFK